MASGVYGAFSATEEMRKLMLKAFGESQKLTIRQRAEIVIQTQQQVSSILNQFEWELLNRKATALVDIRDGEKSYLPVLTNVKQGLNAKVVRPIRYKEDDIADISSNCHFYEPGSFGGLTVVYLLGYPTTAFHAFMFGIEQINVVTLLSKEQLRQIAKLIITQFQPLFLSLVDYSFFHEVSKASEQRIPWTGCFTYISNKVSCPPIPAYFQVEEIEGLGRFVTTAIEDNEESFTISPEVALSFERFLIENKVKV